MEGYKNTLVYLIITAILVGIRSQQTTIHVCGDNDKVPCDDGHCIENRRWCDGAYDCADDSDENYCRTKTYFWSSSPNKCSDIHFGCNNGRCVPAFAECNEYDNCGDYSDEDPCEPIEPLSPTTEASTSTDLYNVYYRHSSTRSTIGNPSTTPGGNFPETTSYYDKKYEESIPHNPYPPPVYHVINSHTRYKTPPTTYSTSYPTTYSTYIPRRTTPDPNNVHSPHGYKLIPPRSVLNLPLPRPSYSDRYRSQNLNLPAFYFAENYTKDYQYDYEDIVNDAKKWLISQRDSSYSWGKDTPRALIALSLTTNSFSSNVSDNYLMKKSLQSHLGIKVLRNETGVEKMSTTRVAMYINAVLATCQNPSNFLGLDLVDMLFQTRRNVEHHQGFLNPLIYLTLCLANKSVDQHDIRYLESLLLTPQRGFRSELSKDIHILTMTALSCFLHTNVAKNSIRSKLQEAARHLLTQRNTTNGSFGSVYTTALAAQALMSINMTTYWDPRPTLNYIAAHQAPDGSFGDMLLTYHSIIALSGRSLVHLRNTLCDPVTEKNKEVSDCSAAEIVSRPGPTKNIFYTLRIGHPETFSVSQQLTVPSNTDFMDIMCVAKHMDPRYKFKYKITNGLHGVYSVADIPNDPERGLFWSLYVLQPGKLDVDIIHDRYKADMKTLVPHDGQELLFWYLPSS